MAQVLAPVVPPAAPYVTEMKDGFKAAISDTTAFVFSITRRASSSSPGERFFGGNTSKETDGFPLNSNFWILMRA